METQLELPPACTYRILVAGEVILDRYLSGEVSRISPEAPIPVLRVTGSEERPGNAAFVCANLVAFGARPTVLSVVGDDSNGRIVREMLERIGVSISGLARDVNRPTIVKERLLGSVQSAHRGVQQLLRVDHEDSQPICREVETALLDRLNTELVDSDGVLVCDINKGLLTPRVLSVIIQQARVLNKPVIVDPRLSDDLSIYRGATALTPNRYETERATGIKLDGPIAWEKAARRMIEMLDLEACLITLDRDGMFLAERDGAATHIGTTPREVYDVTGAGDVVLTIFGLFLMGADALLAARLANLAAGLEVEKQGATVISRDDVKRALQTSTHSSLRKILSLDTLIAELDRHRKAGRRICFTNGCFDLLHAGHVQSLEFSRAQGDVLVVALNSDRSVRELKGPERPVYAAADRARILSALEAVDYVVVFDESHAENVIRAVQPDVLVKGEDWRGKAIDGEAFVASYGGAVVLAQLLDGHATTRTIERLSGFRVTRAEGLSNGATPEATE
jgi:D-beta-D-heptose 7-phosphate kinase / D-beta-D-heptose 1-phosphate adenosyltransferase